MEGGTIRVGCGQMRATFLNEADVALKSVRELLEQGGQQRLDLLVLPECAYPAYLLGSVESYRRAKCLSGEEFLVELQAGARKYRMHVVSGFVHEVGDRLFNGAALISPEGRVIGVYHKQLLWHVDARWFERGQEIAAFDCELGRIGILICADARIPELTATLIADGAQLIALPTCWINTATGPGEFYNPQSDFLIRARSLEFGVPFVCANKFGKETGNVGYNGQSMITAADGSVLAQAGGEFQGVLAAELSLATPRRSVMAPRWREVIRSSKPAETPASANADRITVALMSGDAVRGILQSSDAASDVSLERFVKGVHTAGVSLLIARAGDEHTAERLTQWGAAHRVAVAAFPERTEVGTLAGTRVGFVSAQAARSFAACRALALEGAQFIGVFGETVNPGVLRARALENRVYVAAVGSSAVQLFGVNGEPLSSVAVQEPALTECGEGFQCFHIEPGRANDKCVAPDTDVFVQRRSELYRL